MQRFRFSLPLFALVAACGGGEAPEAGQNDAQRVTEQIEKQAQQIARESENGTAAIEAALENEGAAIFENRAALLNETAGNAAAPQAPRQP